MSQWFECKVKYDRMMENGTMKTVSEPYLVDALSFTEAEARITDKMQPYISGEFSVDTVKRVKLSDVFYNDADFEIASITETPLMDVFPADLSETQADREARQKAQNQ